MDLPEISSEDRPLLLKAYYNDSTVHRLLDAQASLSQVVSALVADKQGLIGELGENRKSFVLLPLDAAVEALKKERDEALGKLAGAEALLRRMSEERSELEVARNLMEQIADMPLDDLPVGRPFQVGDVIYKGSACGSSMEMPRVLERQDDAVPEDKQIVNQWPPVERGVYDSGEGGV